MNRAATDSRTRHTFRSGPYLEDLMAELNRAAICSRIAEARLEAGLTQPELGELLQPPVHYRTVQTWESTKEPRVPWDRLDEIARVTGKTKEWLLHGEEALEQAGELSRLREALEASGRELRDELARQHDEVVRRLDEQAEQLRSIAVARGNPPG
jgi:transcriptional regulator with XRE-family HTH domain